MIRLWIRDGEPPRVKCLAAGSMPRQPHGRVVDVEASTLTEALKILRLASGEIGTPPEPARPEDRFKTLWDWSQQKAAIEVARTMIREVPRA